MAGHLVVRRAPAPNPETRIPSRETCPRDVGQRGVECPTRNILETDLLSVDAESAEIGEVVATSALLATSSLHYTESETLTSTDQEQDPFLDPHPEIGCVQTPLLELDHFDTPEGAIAHTYDTTCKKEQKHTHSRTSDTSIPTPHHSPDKLLPLPPTTDGEDTWKDRGSTRRSNLSMTHPTHGSLTHTLLRAAPIAHNIADTHPKHQTSKTTTKITFPPNNTNASCQPQLRYYPSNWAGLCVDSGAERTVTGWHQAMACMNFFG